MPGATTDVRDWLREQGHKVGDRGSISQALKDEYDAAHPAAAQASVIESRYDAGVSDADFPGELTGDDAGAAAAAPAPAPPAPPSSSGERRPRVVRPSRPRFPKIFGFGRGSGKGKGRRRGASHPRVSLGDFAEETWLDLAWLAAPVPPLAMMLELQAPYAGVVLDEQVRGTVIDAALQPMARYSHVFRALNGLIGPPVCVLMICAEGRQDPDTGQFDGRTKMMFGMLRYSLLQMAKVSELSSEEIGERTESMAARIKIVDGIVNRLFGFDQEPGPGPGADGDEQGAPAGTTGPAVHHAYSYPPGKPVMDQTGADPARV